MPRIKLSLWFFVFFSLCGLVVPPLLPIRGGISSEINTSEKADLNLSDYTIGVMVGDEQRYTVTSVYDLQPDGSVSDKVFVMIAHETLQKNHELLITITEIDQRNVWFDISLKQSNGSYQKLETAIACRSHSSCLYSEFVTTTNRVLLEDSLQARSNIQYEISGLILNLTKAIWYTDREMGFTWIYVYDLSMGWLLSLHYRVRNQTHLLQEYKIRINTWFQFWSSASVHPNSSLDTLPALQILELSTIMFFVAILVIVVRRRKSF